MAVLPHEFHRTERPDWFRQLAAATREFLFPYTCPVCRKELLSASEKLHPECAGQLVQMVQRRSCDRCAAPLPENVPSQMCGRCRNERFPFERVVAIGVYGDVLRDVCVSLKDNASQPLAVELAQLMVSSRRDELTACQINLVTPVPQHWSQRLTRPITLSEVLSMEIARHLGVSMDGRLLVQTRWRPTQSTLTPSQRRLNTRDVFAARCSKAIRGRRILLVDDILTTGATAAAASRALLSAGASGVVVAVAARGLGQ